MLGLSGIKLVRPERLELPALGSEDRCSIQLSYGRNNKDCPRLLRARKVEPSLIAPQIASHRCMDSITQRFSRD